MMDDPGAERGELSDALQFLRTVNRRCGGASSLLAHLGRWSGRWPRAGEGVVTMLDIGTGSADIPVAARSWAARRGFDLVGIAHLNEQEVIINLGKEFIAEKISERKKARITHRLLVRANDPGLIPPLETYHSIPDKYFSKHPLYIYGSKLAILAWDPTKSGFAKSVVINDERFADCARKLFDFIWDQTEEVKQKTYLARKKRGSP
jgi:hypothetical protein